MGPSPGHQHQMVEPEKKQTKKKKNEELGGSWEISGEEEMRDGGQRGWKAGLGLMVGFLRMDLHIAQGWQWPTFPSLSF